MAGSSGSRWCWRCRPRNPPPNRRSVGARERRGAAPRWWGAIRARFTYPCPESPLPLSALDAVPVIAEVSGHGRCLPTNVRSVTVRVGDAVLVCCAWRSDGVRVPALARWVPAHRPDPRLYRNWVVTPAEPSRTAESRGQTHGTTVSLTVQSRGRRPRPARPRPRPRSVTALDPTRSFSPNGVNVPGT